MPVLPFCPPGKDSACPIISPSILSSDFANLASECERMLQLGADWLHVDVMDGNFVPNLTLGAPIVKSLSKHTKGFLDCHLMVSNPSQWVGDFAAAGAHMYTFHLESVVGPQPPVDGSRHADVEGLIQRIRDANMYVGLAIKPGTPVEAMLPYCDTIDMALVMTVEPGFGGQKYMPECSEKCRKIRAAHPTLHIQVDGGLALSTIDHAAQCGANVIVAGSAVFGAADPGAVIAGLRSSVANAALA